jgi:DNA-damage-inducible protein J
MEEAQKRQLDLIFADMGMNMSTGFNIYARKVLKSRKIPFEIKSEDPFYSDSNIKRLKESVKQLEEGKTRYYEPKEVENEKIVD